MSHPKVADLEALLEALVNGDVEFVVVGGVAAVLHGAPVTTLDLDIVHRRTEENVSRLLSVLSDLEAETRPPRVPPLRPTKVMLLGAGQLNLSTRLGPLDPLCVLSSGEDYEALTLRSVTVHDGALSIRIVNLETLIRLKMATGRAKDKLMLPVLIALQRKRSPKEK